MTFRGNYWNCSDFSNWILRVAGAKEKPRSGTSAEWKAWTRYNKTNHPIAYWIADDGLSILQDIVCWPADKLSDLRSFIRQRFIKRANWIKTDLPATGYISPSELMLHGMFTILVNYVEVYSAYEQISWGNADPVNIPWWAKRRLTHWAYVRSRFLGMQRLNWEATLDGPDMEYPCERQARTAREIRDLYLWWKDVRPSRVEPGILSGYDALLEIDPSENVWDIFDLDKPDTMREARKQARDREAQIEAEYEAEDEAMMARLIKVKGNL